MKFSSIIGAVLAVTAFFVVGAAQASTLDDVKSAGNLKCGINTGLPGFAFTDDKGSWKGFDVAFCRALAAAVLGNPDKVKYVNLTGKTRFPALASGEVDVLSRNTTWTFSRDVDLGFTFLGVSYYDGQGFIGRKSLGIKSAKEAGVIWDVIHDQYGPDMPASLFRKLFEGRKNRMVKRKLWPKDKPLPDIEQFVERALLQATLRSMGYYLQAPPNVQGKLSSVMVEHLNIKVS